MTTILRRTMDWLLSPAAARLIGEPFFHAIGRRKVKSEIDPSQVRSILVVRLDQVGDVVLTSPFLRELRRMFPGAWITLIVKPRILNLVEGCPHVNEVLTYDWNLTAPLGRLRLHARALDLARRRLWGRQFDLAILPRWPADYYHASFVVYFSGAAWRLGYSEAVIDDKNKINAGFDCLFTHLLGDRELKHEVQHNLDVLSYLGAAVTDTSLELWLSGQDEVFAERTLSSHGVRPDEYLLAFGIGAGSPNKIWPLINFLELGKLLERDFHPRILAVGGPEETALGEQLQRGLGERVINATGPITIRQMAALLKRCHLYVGNDSGPMHLAAAAGSAVVGISCHSATGDQSHASSPARFHPWAREYAMLQPTSPSYPCGSSCQWHEPHCILGVQVEKVEEAARLLLARIPPASPSTAGTLHVQ